MIRSKFVRGAGLLTLLALPAAAGPVDDGIAAFQKGDYGTAATAFTVGAAQGDSNARAYLGLMFLDGTGIKQDPAQALFWLSQSAEQGNPMAQTTLGTMSAQGRYVKQNWTDAINFYQKAVAQNFIPAESALGDLYVKGYGTTKPDYAKGLPLLSHAAQAGDPQAQFDLGFLYYTGRGVTQNYTMATSLFQAAANQNNVEALAWMGIVYAAGQGVPVDEVKSATYLKLAGARGNLDALGLLGEDYVAGRGVTQDNVRGYMLTNIAADAFPPGAARDTAIKERDQAASHLTPIERQAAQQLGSFCHDAGYIVCVDDSLSVMSENNDPKGQLQRLIAAAQKAHQQEAGANAQTASAAPSSGKPELVATGTGFYVSAKGDIVTAAHVVKDCTEMRAQGLTLKVIAADTVSDVALIASDAKPATFIRLRGGRGPRVGEAVVAVGFPLHGLLGEDQIVTTGIVSSLAGMQNDRRFIQISAPVQPGNSGGPIIGEDGALVGVLQGGLNAVKMAEATGNVPQNVNFAVSASTLQSFLNAHQTAYMLADGNGAKKGSAQIASDAQRYTMLLECWK